MDCKEHCWAAPLAMLLTDVRGEQCWRNKSSGCHSNKTCMQINGRLTCMCIVACMTSCICRRVFRLTLPQRSCTCTPSERSNTL